MPAARISGVALPTVNWSEPKLTAPRPNLFADDACARLIPPLPGKRCRSVAPSSSTTSTSARYPWLAECHAHAAIAAPLLVSGEVVGAIAFVQSAPGAGFDEDAVAKVTILAGATGHRTRSSPPESAFPRRAAARQHSGGSGDRAARLARHCGGDGEHRRPSSCAAAFAGRAGLRQQEKVCFSCRRCRPRRPGSCLDRFASVPAERPALAAWRSLPARWPPGSALR